MKIHLVAIDKKDDLIKLATAGNITSDAVDGGTNPLEPLLGSDWATNRVLLDMADTGYIDSSAIGWLIGTHKAFKQKGGAIVIHSLQPSVKQVLDLLKVGRVVPMVDDEAAAREVAIGGAA